MNTNVVVLGGRLAKDPETKEFDNGNKVANMFMISNSVFYDKNKEKQEKSVAIEVSAFGGQANFAAYLKKGDPITVTAKLEERSYEKDGVKIKVHYLVASNIESNGGKRSNDEESKSTDNEENSKPAENSSEEYSDDVPF